MFFRRTKRAYHATAVGHAQKRFEDARALYTEKLSDNKALCDCYAATRAYVCALADITDIPGFTATELINEKEATSALYRGRLTEKNDRYDEERRAELTVLAGRKDSSALIPSEMRVFFVELERAYFAQEATS